MKGTLDEVLKKYAAQGKRTFELRSLFRDVGTDPKILERVILQYFLSGKISARLQPRCPDCGKDLGAFDRLSQVPEELHCEVCGATFPRDLEYLDVICTVTGIDFFRGTKSEGALPETQLLKDKVSLRNLLDSCFRTDDIQLKGRLFEQFFESVVSRDGEFKIVSKHARSKVGEIDYVLGHELQSNFWQMSPYVYVECKNWSKTIPVAQIDHFIALVKKAGPYCTMGIYLATSSLSAESEAAFRDARINDRLTLVAIQGNELQRLIEAGFNEQVRTVFEARGLK